MPNLTDRELLIQQSEKLINILAAIQDIKVRVKETNEKIDLVEARIKDDFVTKEEFAPVKQLVYGLVVLILVAVGGALIAMVVNSGAGVIP